MLCTKMISFSRAFEQFLLETHTSVHGLFSYQRTLITFFRFRFHFGLRLMTMSYHKVKLFLLSFHRHLKRVNEMCQSISTWNQINYRCTYHSLSTTASLICPGLQSKTSPDFQNQFVTLENLIK